MSSVGRSIAYEVSGRSRHDDLSTVCRGADPCGDVHIHPDVPFVPEIGLAGVDADAHPHVRPLGHASSARAR